MSKIGNVVVPWFNASAQGGTCFDVQLLDTGIVQTRNSTRPGVVTDHRQADWTAFVAGVKGGEFDHTLV